MLLSNYSFSSQITLQAIPSNISKAQKILELIYKNKYFTNAQLLYAKVKYLLGEKSFCMEIVQNILRIDSDNLDAFTLYAIALIENKDYSKAKEIINEAMLNNLSQSREHGYFLISKVKCEVGSEDTNNAHKTLKDLLDNFDKYEKSEKNCKFIKYTNII